MEHKRDTSYGKDTLVGTFEEFSLLGKAIVIANNRNTPDEAAACNIVGEAIINTLDPHSDQQQEIETYSDRIMCAAQAVTTALSEVAAYQIISGQESPIASGLTALHEDIVPQRPMDHL